MVSFPVDWTSPCSCRYLSRLKSHICPKNLLTGTVNDWNTPMSSRNVESRNRHFRKKSGTIVPYILCWMYFTCRITNRVSLGNPTYSMKVITMTSDVSRDFPSVHLTFRGYSVYLTTNTQSRKFVSLSFSYKRY